MTNDLRLKAIVGNYKLSLKICRMLGDQLTRRNKTFENRAKKLEKLTPKIIVFLNFLLISLKHFVQNYRVFKEFFGSKGICTWITVNIWIKRIALIVCLATIEMMF